MKIAVAEFPDEPRRYEAAIDAIAGHIEHEKPDLLVLPEMPFTTWEFYHDRFNSKAWDRIVASHELQLDRFLDIVHVPILTSRPVTFNGKCLNQSFYYHPSDGVRPLRSKFYLPNDFPAVEVPWFHVGDDPKQIFDLGEHKIGVQLCSEIMYSETPRLLGSAGAELIIQPRATGGHPRWRAASLLSAATSGAFVISANRHSEDRDWFTGGSWVYNPDGALLIETSSECIVRSVVIEVAASATAKRKYPMTMFLR